MVLPLVATLVVLAPGAVLTPVALPPVLGTLYHDFGNVSAGDFALLACAGPALPAGARVLVAPGSAAEFLPGYAPDLVLLYPLAGGWPGGNASYRLLVHDLPNATALDGADRAALRALEVGYVAVTGANTVLWPAFSPAPFLAEPAAFPVLFHAGDAYLFANGPGAPPLGCG